MPALFSFGEIMREPITGGARNSLPSGAKTCRPLWESGNLEVRFTEELAQG